VKIETQSGGNSQYSLQYHLLLTTKDNDSLITKEVAADLKNQIDHIAEKKDLKIINKEITEDYVHILFRATPTTELSRTVNSLKGATSRKLRNKYEHLQERTGLWAPAYFLATTGDVTLEQLKEYKEDGV
jgi:putative transposase